MSTPCKESDLSIIFKEVDRLSSDTDLAMTKAELSEYEEIRILGEILLQTDPKPVLYFTGN